MTDFSLTPEQKEQLRDLSSAQIESLRLKTKTNLYFCSKGVLGYNQVEEGAHLALCNFMTNEPNPYRMVLVFRGFLKSTICTISDSIRLALCDPETARILIVNEIFDNAAGFLDELKAHWTHDGMLPFLFPELVPEKTIGPGSDWSQARASLNRQSPYKEATWTAFGVGGAAQSMHFSHIKCDDLIGTAAKESEAVMQRTIRWTDTLTGLLDRLGGPIDYYGTRKTMNDLYSYIQQMYGSRIKVFSREPFDEKGESIFGKMPTAELLSIMVDKPEVWAHDYMNNPIGKGGIDWGDGFLRYWEPIMDGDHVRAVKLEDTITGRIKRWERSELDIVITVDPNSGKAFAPDKAAVLVHGISPDDEIIVLESWAGRPSPDGLLDVIWQLAQEWHPRVIGIEEVATQNTIYWFEKRCNDERQYYRLQPLKPRGKDKERRIRVAMDTPLKARKVYVLRTHYGLINGVNFFPQLRDHQWDELDSLAYGPQLYQTGMRDSDREAEYEAERKILSIRGPTGYGNSCVRTTRTFRAS